MEEELILQCSECGVLEEVSRRIRPRQRCEDHYCTGRMQIMCQWREKRVQDALARWDSEHGREG